jgi:hypothetical protein
LDAKYEAENQAMLEHYGAVEVTVARNSKGQVVDAVAVSRTARATFCTTVRRGITVTKEFTSVRRGDRAKARQRN